MKTTKFITALMAIFAIAFLSTLESCTKDDDNNGSGTVAVTKAGLLTSSGWIMKSMVATFPAPIGDMDLYAMEEECAKDDILLFKSDKTITGDEGAIKCDPADPQTTDEGTWELTSNDTKLVLTDDGEVTEFTITSLTSTELLMELTQYDSSFQAEITMKVGFKH
jgi:hypothetical protein